MIVAINLHQQLGLTAYVSYFADHPTASAVEILLNQQATKNLHKLITDLLNRRSKLGRNITAYLCANITSHETAMKLIINYIRATLMKATLFSLCLAYYLIEISILRRSKPVLNNVMLLRMKQLTFLHLSSQIP